jgi:hypothetical protein
MIIPKTLWCSSAANKKKREFAGDIILTFVHLTITNTRFLQRLRVLAQKVPDIAVRISFLFSLSDFQTIDIDKVMIQFM